MRKRVVGVAKRCWDGPRNRSFTVAVLVAFALRLAWAIFATGRISSDLSDPAQYLHYAERFSTFDTPVVNGQHTAFLPPGYPMFLAPLSLLARHTSLISVNFAASLCNVVLGTATVVFTALLARVWIGPGARNPAAWIMALAAGHIYYTSVVLSETLFTALSTGLLLAASALAVRHGRAIPRKDLLLLGVGVGFCLLVRAPGLILAAAPALALRATAGSWNGAVRATGWVLVGSLVLLVPWAVRNAVQVGVPTPVSTNNAAFLCTGHHPGATGLFDDTEAGLRYCYTGSPFDPDHPDEARWYRRTTSRALHYALTHPVDELRLTLWKTYDTMSDDRQSVSDAEDFGARHLFDERQRGIYVALANAWYWGVCAFAAAGLVWVRACRRALPLWVTAAVSLVAVWGGLALTRYHHPIMPILVVFAAGAVAVLAERSTEADLGVTA